MGAIEETMGCNCFRCPTREEKGGTTEDRKEKGEIPKSILDVQLKTQNFVIKRNQTVYNIYKKELLLGQGAFSEVYKVRKIDGNEVRVIKEIMKSSLEDVKKLLNEIEILSKLDHPNVVKIYEYYEDNDMIHLVESYLDEGELSEKMDRYGIFCEFLVKYVMYHIFHAVSFLHSNNVIHGDIKREHILLSNLNKKVNDKKEDIFKRLSENKKAQEELIKADNVNDLSETANNLLKDLTNIEVLLSDFGEAKMKKKLEKNKIITGMTGSTFYLSPEATAGNYDFECDEWSCGVLMYILLSGVAPFNGSNEDEIVANIQQNEVDLNIEELKNVSDSCKDLMSKLLEKDAKKRIKSIDALKHEFFTKGIDIRKLMEGDKETNILKLNSFMQKTTTERNKANFKRTLFREAVIAYMALNFTDSEQAMRIKSIFTELSGDNPKYEITKETFVEKMKELLKGKYSKNQLSDIFDTIDEDINGKIEYEELNRALGDQKKLINENNLRETFNFFDEDKNGKISLNEIYAIVFKDKEIPLNVKKEFLEEIGLQDENSKEITYQKFKEIMGYKD